MSDNIGRDIQKAQTKLKNLAKAERRTLLSVAEAYDKRFAAVYASLTPKARDVVAEAPCKRWQPVLIGDAELVAEPEALSGAPIELLDDEAEATE